MPEAGGPATQAGIFFQNTVAALYLGRMLDMRLRARRDRVLHVRVEAPEDVDDIVARMGDGSRRFIQAKLSLDASSEAWNRLWQQFWKQLSRRTSGVEDRLVLVFGDACRMADDLAESCSRAGVVADEQEFLIRMSGSQRLLFDRIEAALAPMKVSGSDIRKMLSRVDIEVYPHRFIDATRRHYGCR
jgi:hypothetical protein